MMLPSVYISQWSFFCFPSVILYYPRERIFKEISQSVGQDENIWNQKASTNSKLQLLLHNSGSSCSPSSPRPYQCLRVVSSLFSKSEQLSVESSVSWCTYGIRRVSITGTWTRTSFQVRSSRRPWKCGMRNFQYISISCQKFISAQIIFLRRSDVDFFAFQVAMLQRARPPSPVQSHTPFLSPSLFLKWLAKSPILFQ